MTTMMAPSPSARRLFGKMVAHANENLHLTLPETIALSVDLMRSGEDYTGGDAVTELVAMQWIDPAPDGGWLLH